MISICVTIKNRSRVMVDEGDLFLFPNCVKAIADSVRPDTPCELIVTDWESDDWPLSEWLEQAISPVPYQIIPVVGGFSRGRGLNIAAEAAQGDYLLFTDADSLLCTELLRSGAAYLQAGNAFFPVLYSYYGPEHREGWWRHEGYGNCMVTKKTFTDAGGWPEYATWGKEDDDFHAKIASLVSVVREEVPGFYHQWHPDDRLWKNRYSDHIADVIQEMERLMLQGQEIKRATDELKALIPQEESFIFVDDSHFGNNCFPAHRVLPFTELDGAYGGPPADSAAAIQELERLRARGAVFISFVWMTFWWLDYYSDFERYLRSNFACISKTDRLVVFDLRLN